MHKLSGERAHQGSWDEREQNQFGSVVEKCDRIDRKGDNGIQCHAAEISCIPNPKRQTLDQDHKGRKDSCRAECSNLGRGAQLR